MRVFWVVVTVVFSLLAALAVVGTALSLFGNDDELVASAVILAGSLAFAAVGWYRLRVLGRRALAAARDFGRWLPAAGPGDGDHPALIARLRRASRRATGFAVGWAVVFAAGATVVTLVGSAADDLLATGVREPGEVVRLFDPVKGAAHIWVRHGDRTDEIVWDSGRDYHVGDEVTVVYDPADPARVRTTDEKNEDRVELGFGVVPMLAALFGLPFSIAAAAGWRRRLRAVTRTGWRRAGVSVAPELAHGVTRGKAVVLHAGFRDGTAIALRRSAAIRALPGMPAWENRQGWVGGWGGSMVVAFEDGPAVLPAYAIRERVSRSRP
ncbi:DUF3592 domain-containing protein [Amycolatopsis sp. NPDC098790]|uniref:DUF3592 domain-containing protein n=1 Tax=Amycolatopsis sp. NPDC098790 TaxID=3363939 RepID=UPI003822C180